MVAAVIELCESSERKTRQSSKVDTQESSYTSLDQKDAFKKFRFSTLLNKEMSRKHFGPARKIGVCETDKDERVLVTKALIHYNRLEHLDLNF